MPNLRNMKHNLIIVDDHKMFLDGLLSILNTESDYNVLLTSRSGVQVATYIDTQTEGKIDLVIMDVTMPQMSGVQLNELIKSRNPKIRTLVVSMHSDAGTIDTLIEAGADGYLPKNAEKTELLNAIATILKGKKYFSKEIKDIYLENRLSGNRAEEIKLTRREIDVITLIAEEFTTQEIAEKLFLSKHTVESYRKNLMTKLNVKNIAGLTKYALRMKYTQY